jgi:hypothetical protein
MKKNQRDLNPWCAPLKIWVDGPRSVGAEPLDDVIPAWSAGIQADMDVSGRIFAKLMPAVHAGMTIISIS